MSLRSALVTTTRLHEYRQRSIARKVCSSVSSFSHSEHAHHPVSSVQTCLVRATDPTGILNPEAEGPEPGELSDQEWEIRTGRAIYILQQTLPTFFSTGLISSVDISGGNEKGDKQGDIHIYSSDVRLEYRPPVAFPPPFPRTLHVEGLPLYVGSSVFVRHTLSALYTGLHVELQRVRVHGPQSLSDRLDAHSDKQADLPRPQQVKTRSNREKSLFISLMVHGTNRVSKTQGGWQVNSTYTFSPNTGLIHLHVVDSIYPAPHQAFFSALQAALSKLGLGGSSNAQEGGMARSQLPHQDSKACPLG